MHGKFLSHTFDLYQITKAIMTLSQYINQLQEIAKENPELLEKEVVFSDPEGNDFRKVVYPPSVGVHLGREFEETSAQKANSVCIN